MSRQPVIRLNHFTATLLTWFKNHLNEFLRKYGQNFGRKKERIFFYNRNAQSENDLSFSPAVSFSSSTLLFFSDVKLKKERASKKIRGKREKKITHCLSL